MKTSIRTVARALDAPAFMACMYFSADAIGRAVFNVSPARWAISIVVLSLVILLALSYLAKDNSRWPVLDKLNGVVAILIAFLFLKFLAMPAPPESDKFKGGAWIVSEWHQAPRVWFYYFASFKAWSIPFLLAYGSAAVLRLRGHRYALLIFNGVVITAIVVYTFFNVPDDLFLAILAIFPATLAIVTGALRLECTERRASIAHAIFALAFANYIGLLPLWLATPEFPGLHKLYPTGDQDPGIPMAHWRGIAYDKSSARLYATWGETSGIFAVSLTTGTEQIIDHDLIRFPVVDKQRQTIYGCGWHKQEFLEYRMQPLKLLRKKNLGPDGFGQLFAARRLGDDLFVSSLEPPVFGKFDFASLKAKKIVDMRELGHTQMPAGPALFEIHPDGSKIYLGMAMVGIPQRYELFEVDPMSLAVLRKVVIPEMYGNVVLDPERGEVLLPSYANDDTYIIDMHTFKIKGKFDTAAHARMVYVDPERDVIIAGSYYNGELAVIQRTTRKKLLSKKISRRIQFGRAYPERSELVFNTTEGAYRLDLDEMMEGVKEMFDNPAIVGAVPMHTVRDAGEF